MRRKPSAHAAAKPAAARAIAALAASALLLVLAGCGRSPAPGASAKASAQAAASVGPVLAVETFLADIAQQVAGSRLTVGTLMPAGIDPHSYEPTPRDVSTVTESRALIVNGAGMESFLQKLLASAGGERRLIEASAGLEPRKSGSEPDPHFFLGKGKVEEVRVRIAEAGATLLLFDEELSPSQGRHLEEALAVRVMDRTELILDIFALRARSHEARTQVELAQLRYLVSRLTRMWVHLSRIRGGIGLRGPGETQIETDRRAIRQKIGHLK